MCGPGPGTPELYGLLGPNGAGRSTLMRILATLQEPDEGTVHLGALDVLDWKEDVRRTRGYLPQAFAVALLGGPKHMIVDGARLRPAERGRFLHLLSSSAIQRSDLDASFRRRRARLACSVQRHRLRCSGRRSTAWCRCAARFDAEPKPQNERACTDLMVHTPSSLPAAASLLATLLVASCGASPVAPDPGPDSAGTLVARIDTALAGEIDAYLEAIPDDDAGLSILVRHDDEIVYYGSRGVGDRSTGMPLTEHSLFRLASVSKLFTAVAVMQLVERGDVGLDDSVLKYFPEFDASWEPMTVHMLLSHRTGTYDFLSDFIGSPWRHDIDNQKVVDYFVDNPRLKFAPGTQAAYSNSNYVLLAEMIGRVAGVRFAEYMRTQLFEPLGMVHTYCRDANTALSERETLNFARHDTYFGLHTYTVGPMGMVSSTYEIDLFMRALSRGELLGAKSMAQMRNPYATLFGASYGYGMMFGDDWYGHGGSLDGAQTNVTFYPQRNVHVVMLSNGGSRTYGAMRAVASIVEGYY